MRLFSARRANWRDTRTVFSLSGEPGEARNSQETVLVEMLVKVIGIGNSRVGGWAAETAGGVTRW